MQAKENHCLVNEILKENEVIVICLQVKWVTWQKIASVWFDAVRSAVVMMNLKIAITSGKIRKRVLFKEIWQKLLSVKAPKFWKK